MKKRFDCRKCKKFKICTGLCSKANDYADKDEVKQREETIGIPVITRPANLSVGEALRLTSKEKEILTLMELHGFSRQETAKFLKISRNSLRFHLFNIRSKIMPETKES